MQALTLPDDLSWWTATRKAMVVPGGSHPWFDNTLDAVLRRLVTGDAISDPRPRRVEPLLCPGTVPSCGLVRGPTPSQTMALTLHGCPTRWPFSFVTSSCTMRWNTSNTSNFLSRRQGSHPHTSRAALTIGVHHGGTRQLWDFLAPGSDLARTLSPGVLPHRPLDGKACDPWGGRPSVVWVPSPGRGSTTRSTAVAAGRTFRLTPSPCGSGS